MRGARGDVTIWCKPCGWKGTGYDGDPCPRCGGYGPPFNHADIYPGTPSGAVFDAGGASSPWRYTLHRSWAPSRPPEVWVMCNPSTATAERDDATIRRVKRYSHDWGAGGFLVVNLWALRSTLPEGLHECSKLEVPRDPIGTWNDYAIDLAIRQAAIGAGRVVCAWGAVAETGPAWEDRVRVVVEACRRHGVTRTALASSASGAPRHPLRLARNLGPIPWQPPPHLLTMPHPDA